MINLELELENNAIKKALAYQENENKILKEAVETVSNK